MGYVTRFTPHARWDMLKVPRPDALRILHRLAELQKALDVGAAAPFDIKALQGQGARWRLRVGDYRAVYTVGDGQLIVWLLAAATVAKSTANFHRPLRCKQRRPSAGG